MALELEFIQQPLDVIPPTARVVLNPVIMMSGLPSVTTDCVTMGELEGQLMLLERQIAAIRKAAKQKFVSAGISN